MPAQIVDVLGQAAPGGATDVALYTVPASRQAVLSRIYVANTGPAATYRVHVCPSGAAASAGNAIAYEVNLGQGASDPLPGITVAAGDVVRVRSSSGTVTFTAFGTEYDA